MTDDIISAVRRALPSDVTEAGLHEPEFRGRELEYLHDCIESGWVSYSGSYVDRFERELAALCGRRHALAVVNGTVALHAAFATMGIGAGDEVVIPSLTFVATANSVVMAGAAPHLVECEERTLGLDIPKLRAHLAAATRRVGERCVNTATGRRIAALVPVHVFGQPIDHAALDEVAREFGVPVVTDATESLGTIWRGRPAAANGLMSVLSFNGNKIVTTGGGGAVLTDDDALAKTVRHLSTTAKEPHAWAFNHDRPAFNYRMPNLNAAVGCAQLERLPQVIEEKRRLFDAYVRAFSDVPGVEIMREPPDTRSNYWLVAMKLSAGRAPERDAVLGALHAAGLKCRPLWTPMHMLPMFADVPRMRDLSVTEAMFSRVINLPSSPKLGR